MFELFYKLVIGHALADYSLQITDMAKGKNRHTQPKDHPVPLMWFYWLSSHSLIHSGVVWFITGSILVAIMELIFHWIIDFIKCEGWTNMHIDQLLHILTKILYVYLIINRI